MPPMINSIIKTHNKLL